MRILFFLVLLAYLSSLAYGCAASAPYVAVCLFPPCTSCTVSASSGYLDICGCGNTYVSSTITVTGTLSITNSDSAVNNAFSGQINIQAPFVPGAVGASVEFYNTLVTLAADTVFASIPSDSAYSLSVTFRNSLPAINMDVNVPQSTSSVIPFQNASSTQALALAIYGSITLYNGGGTFDGYASGLVTIDANSLGGSQTIYVLNKLWKATGVPTGTVSISLTSVFVGPSLTSTKFIDNAAGAALVVNIQSCTLNKMEPNAINALIKDTLSLTFTSNTITNSVAGGSLISVTVDPPVANARRALTGFAVKNNTFDYTGSPVISLAVHPSLSLPSSTFTADLGGNTIKAVSATPSPAGSPLLLTVTGNHMSKYTLIDYYRGAAVAVTSDCNRYLDDFFFSATTHTMRTTNATDAFVAVGAVMPILSNSQTFGSTSWRPQVYYALSNASGNGTYAFFDLFDNPQGYPSPKSYQYRVLYTAQTTLSSDSASVQWVSSSDPATLNGPTTLGALRADGRFSGLYPVTVGATLRGALLSTNVTFVPGLDGLGNYYLGTTTSDLAVDFASMSVSGFTLDATGITSESLLAASPVVATNGTAFGNIGFGSLVVNTVSTSTHVQLGGLLSSVTAPPVFDVRVDALYARTQTSPVLNSVAVCTSCGLERNKLSLRNVNLNDVVTSGSTLASGFARVDIDGATVYVANYTTLPALGVGSDYYGTPTALSPVTSYSSSFTYTGYCGQRTVRELLTAVDRTDFGTSLNFTLPTDSTYAPNATDSWTIVTTGLLLDANGANLTEILVNANDVTLSNAPSVGSLVVGQDVTSITLSSIAVTTYKAPSTLSVSGSGFTAAQMLSYYLALNRSQPYISGDLGGQDVHAVDYTVPTTFYYDNVTNHGALLVGANATVHIHTATSMKNVVLQNGGRLVLHASLSLTDVPASTFAIEVSGTGSGVDVVGESTFVSVPCHGILYHAMPGVAQEQLPTMRFTDTTCLYVGMGVGTRQLSVLVPDGAVQDASGTPLTTLHVADVVRTNTRGDLDSYFAA